MSSLKQTFESDAFYIYNDERKWRSRKDCSGKKCKRYHEVGGSVRCGDYASGWCRSRDKDEGIPHDKLLIEVDTVLKILRYTGFLTLPKGTKIRLSDGTPYTLDRCAILVSLDQIDGKKESAT